MRKGTIELGDITRHNIAQLRKINAVVFPITFQEKFYKEVLNAGELAKLVYYNDVVVGAVCCRVDLSGGLKKMYIMTLGCLAPYRQLGIGTRMLEHILKLCKEDSNYDAICLHTQVSNEGALLFYKKFGFDVVDVAKDYYKRIEPSDAYYLEKKLR